MHSIYNIFYNFYPKSEKSRGSGPFLTLTAVAIGASGILFYAKKNPEFRAALEGWVPGTNKTIQIDHLSGGVILFRIHTYILRNTQAIVSMKYIIYQMIYFIVNISF